MYSQGSEGFECIKFNESLSKPYEIFSGMEIMGDEYTPIVLMQYTGLKDKNGVDIYEGDVVMFYIFGSHEQHVKEIIYDEENLCFCLKYSQSLFTCQFSDEFEKVGTIYENPELLE